MISRQHRFHGRGSLRHVYQHGQTVRDTALSLRFNLNPRRRTYRAAVVVSRKVDKSAVARNRIRRRLYELLRSYEGQIAKPYDLVFTVYSPQLVDIPAAKLNKIVHSQLLRAGVITSTDQPAHAIVGGKES